MKKINLKGLTPTDLDVYWEDRLVGQLSFDTNRRFHFQYSDAWLDAKDAQSISISLPLRKEPYEEDQSRPYFTNLLPEAQILRAISKELGISESNEFSLLAAIGGECAGAISLYPPHQKPSEGGKYESVTREELEKTVQDMPNHPLLMGPLSHGGLRLSLAGAQSKIPIFLKDEAFFLPRGSYSSSHILKPAITGLKGSVENEAFCMALADKIKLGVPKSFILSGKVPLYCIERYDRIALQTQDQNKKTSSSPLKRLHQEDFCQALAIMPDAKYETEGGPNLAKCFQLVVDHSSKPLLDQLRLLRWLIFNHLVGNADAHAKNISFLYINNEVILAPFYDILCTRIYPTLTPNAAMTIGGERQLDWMWRRNWEHLAKDAKIKAKLVIETVHEIANQIPAEAERIEQDFVERGWNNPIIARIRNMIEIRCKKALQRLAPITPS